jgi:H+-translocating NAD(P) transhydrogenase subunit alpha
MIIAVLKETCPGETRVAMVPGLVPAFIKAGHQIGIESQAGAAAGYPDAQYQEQGASIATDRSGLIQRADAVFMVRGPGCGQSTVCENLDIFPKGQLLIGFFNPLMALDTVHRLAEGGLIVFAMELVPRISRAQSMDALSSMTSLSGYKAVLLAANTLPKMFPLMMTAAGSLAPARVFVLGAGVTGLQACATAKRLGALVSAYDVRSAVREQVESVGAQFVTLALPSQDAEDDRGYATAQDDDFIQRQQAEMAKVIAANDVLITTAGVPGKKAPVLVTESMVKAMAPNSVIVDAVADLGGNCELTEPGKVVVKHGVTIIGIENLPGTLAHHASQLLAKNISSLFDHLTDVDGRLILNMKEQITAETLVCYNGEITNQRVREAAGLGHS